MFGTKTLITFLGMVALSTAIKPDNICALVRDGTKVVNDVNCAAYYTCKAGKATAVTCSPGESFNKDGQNCLPKSMVSCFGALENPCEGISGVKFVAKPGSCSGYFYCNNTVAKEGSCPPGMNFNPTDQLCQYQEEYGCTATGVVQDNPNLMCAYLPNGLYFGSATNCKIWQKCTNNILKSGTCADEWVFNVQSLACDYPENYNCQQLNGDAGETGGSTETCTAADSGKVKADPNSCSSYWTCTNGKYVATKCPTGLYYDPGSNHCTSRLDAVNDCDRCEGTTKKFVNAFNDDCKGYLRCEGGKKVGSGQCQDGFYFNEVYESCVRGTNPNFKVCKTVVQPVGCTNCEIAGSAIVCEAGCTCNQCPLPACPDCETAGLTLTCGGTCKCDVCPLPSCTDCQTAGTTLTCGGTCKCDVCALPACTDCQTAGTTLTCGGTCKCDVCALPACTDCQTAGTSLTCGGTCKCDVCALPACTDCQTAGSALTCGGTCKCDVCALPACTDCQTAGSSLICGGTCKCDVCPLPSCTDCQTAGSTLTCGGTCKCDVCALPACPACCADTSCTAGELCGPANCV